MERWKGVLSILGFYLSLSTIISANTCPPGSYVNSGACEKCPNGFFSTQNNSEKCTRCAGCPGQNGHVIHPCNSTANTKCGCDPGYFYGPLLICIRCEQCKRGRGVKQNCSENRNTVCETCVKGKTFSPRKGWKPCFPCSPCPEGYMVSKNCTRRSDTQCKVDWNDMNDTKGRAAVTRSSTRKEELATLPATLTISTRSNPSNTLDLGSESRATQNPVSTTSKDKTMSLLSGLGGFLVIMIFVAGTFYCHRRRQRRGRRHTISRTRQPPDAASEASLSSTDGMTIQENRGSLVPLMAGQKDKLFRNASCGLVEELSMHLNPCKRWKKLAQKLNFNNTQVNNFAIEPNGATEKMLTEWGHGEGSSLSCLRKILLDLKWKHEAEIVTKYM